MPLTRYQIRNEYSLPDPELYRAADRDDPEALLEGVAMAGLVGVLRQLGDLAEFAAGMFHDLHEEVMATAARGHGLMVRVQQLEAEFPSIEKAFLSQTSHSLFFNNTGVDWHPNIRMEQNLIAQGDLPRFVMDSYEECRGPPRLFLLDKFDVAGAGACLKRYTDPSFFKVDSSSSGMMNADVQREKKTRKAKKKGSRWRNGETPDIVPTSHAKLHQLFLEERVESHFNDPARHVKLKRRLNGFPFDSKTGKSYMENFLKCPTPDHNVVREISDNLQPLKLPSNVTGESGIEILEISRLSPEKESLQRKRSSCSSPDVEETGRIPSMDELSQEADYGMSEVPKPHTNSEADTVLSTLLEEVDEKEVMVDGGGKIDGSADGYQSDDIASELENYMDALTTMDAEMETDTECRAKTDMRFLNIKNHGMDSVANEEQQDLQACFSDSQSIGDSTVTADGNGSSRKGISSLSYSDTLSNLVENMPSDGDVTAEILPSTKICEAEIVNMSSDRCLVNGESPLIQPLEHIVCNGVCIEEAEIPRYRPEFGEPSASSCLTDSSLMLLPVDPGTSLAQGASVGSELDEISSDCNEFNAGCIHPEETRTYMGDQLPRTSKLSDVSCQTRDDFLPELSADNHPADELDDEDLRILLHASLHLSNILEVAPAKDCSEILLDDMLQAKYAEDECTKISVHSQIDSLHSVASHTKEKPLDSDLPELETCDPHVEPGSTVSEVDDATPLSGEKSISSNPLVDSPQASNFTKQQFSEITENVSPLEPDSAEVALSNSAEKNPYGALNSADGEKFGGLSDRNMVGKDAAELKFSSDFQNSPDPPPVPRVHVLLDDVVTETVHSEIVVVANAVVGTRCDDSGDNDNSLSTTPTKLHEESISSLQILHQNGLDIDEACLQEFDTENEVDQQAVASSDLVLVMCNAVPYDDSKSELLNNVPHSSMLAISRNSLHIVDAITVPLSSDQNDQDSESKSPKQINVIENTEDAISSPSHHITELRTRMEQKVELQADQYDVESLHAGKESSEPFFQVERIQSPDHLDQEQHTDSSSEFCVAHLPSQPSVVEFLPQLDMSEQATDPSSSILPFGLLPGASQINLDGMPPLPPLPPVQWRIGKVQHASLAPERDLVQHNLDPFPQILASTADEKAQSGHLEIEGEITQPSNPFSLLPAVKEENSQHGYENLAGCIVHSTPLSLQVPTMVGHGNSEDDFPSSGRTQSTNPFLALPTIFSAKSQNGFLASEGGRAQPTSNPFSPVTNVVDTVSTYQPRSSQEKLIQPLHQSAPKISSEDEKLQGTSVISEGKVMNTPETSFPPPVMQHDQPRHVLSTSEGETAWLSSASVPLAPFEGGKPNGNRKMKLPRPRNPLIDAVVAHDKSKLRKVTERLRPQIGQEVDERDSLLEQLRAKSFNLKPAVMTRPSIQGPKTNLKVAAILEKANAIRQALAGSDEDDDANGWSDS